MKYHWSAGPLIAVALMTSAQAQRAAKRPPPRAQLKPALPVFSFKEARAGETMDPAPIGKCNPRNTGVSDEVWCFGTDKTVAGVQMFETEYYFWKSRLYHLNFEFYNQYGDYEILLRAFSEKYGKPCRSSVDRWQSQAGAVFDNATAVWCFATGEMKLQQHGDRFKFGRVDYGDEYRPPIHATPKDF